MDKFRELEIELERIIERLDKEIAEKERELELAIKNQEYLEGIIRRELGLQKVGEDVYIIEDNKTTEEKK